MIWCLVALTALLVETRVAEESRNWSCDAEGLTASFRLHARDLFGYACVLSDADRAAASELVQGTFEAAAEAWCTLRDLPAGKCRDWLRDTLAAAAERQTGHPAGNAFVSPSHRRLTELKMARFASDYDSVAGLERFAGWLQTRAARDTPAAMAADQPSGSAADQPSGSAADQPGGHAADRPPMSLADRLSASARPGEQGARVTGKSGIRPASLHAVPDATPDSTQASGRPAHGNAGTSGNGHSSPGSPHRNGAAVAPGSYGDPVSALYEQHYASLVRLTALLVRDTTTAEEIVQDSFVAVAAAWRRRGNTDGALGFLHQSVLNRSRSALRHGIAPAPAGYPSGSLPLLAALGELPARQREVLVLRYYANLSEEQAADTIGISRAAVRRHATLAGSALRTLLDAG
jgi:DNA-directed RNA polymerase specialized sigma24 family protein